MPLASVHSLLRSNKEGDVDARDELVRRFVPLAERIATRYHQRGESQDDLNQVACLGLLKAIDGYDADRGPFLAYAVPSILGELKRHFRDKGWAMRVPRSLQERVLEVSGAMDVLPAQLGRFPTATDVAAHTGLAVEDVLEALEAGTAYSPVSLDAPPAGDDDGDWTLGDSFGTDDSGYELVDLEQAVAPAFRTLPAREQAILKLRFVDDLKQSEIAERVGISQMHVSRLLRRSLHRLGRAAEIDVAPRT